MDKHTPGPWNQKGRNVYASTDWAGDLQFRSKSMVCSVNMNTFKDKSAALANARLIAAAPELLAALEAIEHYINEEPGFLLDGDERLVRAAIAKAKGAA